jgi:hypothetical protein
MPLEMFLRLVYDRGILCSVSEVTNSPDIPDDIKTAYQQYITAHAQFYNLCSSLHNQLFGTLP